LETADGWASPVITSTPYGSLFFSWASYTFKSTSWASKPEFSAKVLGITSRASAKHWTPNLTLPETCYFE
jgi:hypothetical protein